MLHVPALPGAPLHVEPFGAILDWVLRDAAALAAAGFDGFILENFGDTPFFPRRVPAHTVAFLTVLAGEVKRRFPLALGINVLRNDGSSALAVAAAAGADFIRVNVFTGARVADQGILQGEAHEILRDRRLLGAAVRIFADVAVKHSAPLGQRDLRDEVEDTLHRGHADAVIVSGAGTGKETSLDDLRVVKAAAGRSLVYAGSGVSAHHAAGVLRVADGIIVGTALKRDGVTMNPVDEARARRFVELARGA
jgi:uncharacterized protein